MDSLFDSPLFFNFFEENASLKGLLGSFEHPHSSEDKFEFPFETLESTSKFPSPVEEKSKKRKNEDSQNCESRKKRKTDKNNYSTFFIADKSRGTPIEVSPDDVKALFLIVGGERFQLEYKPLPLSSRQKERKNFINGIGYFYPSAYQNTLVIRPELLPITELKPLIREKTGVELNDVFFLIQTESGEKITEKFSIKSRPEKKFQKPIIKLASSIGGSDNPLPFKKDIPDISSEGINYIFLDTSTSSSSPESLVSSEGIDYIFLDTSTSLSSPEFLVSLEEWNLFS